MVRVPSSFSHGIDGPDSSLTSWAFGICEANSLEWSCIPRASRGWTTSVGAVIFGSSGETSCCRADCRRRR